MDGKLAIMPVTGPTFTLDGLLEDVTEANLHQEIDTGAAIGQEVW